MSTSEPPFNDNDVDELAFDQNVPTMSLASTSAASLHNELVVAWQEVAQLKLHPYQHDTVEEFVKVVYHFRPLSLIQMCTHNKLSGVFQMMLFIQSCVVKNLIMSIKTAAPPFVSLPQLLNIYF